MKAVIFLNGNPPPIEQIKRAIDGADLTICADGAYNYLRDKVIPSVILGDFDSVNGKNFPQNSEIIEFNPEKDYTDGELSIKIALERGYNDIEIYGALGGRPDHEYANYGLLIQAKNGGAKAKIVSENWEISVIEGVFEFDTTAGKTVSLAPLYEDAHIIKLSGLKYSIRNASVNRAQSLTISNQALGDRASVETQGEMLLFVER